MENSITYVVLDGHKDSIVIAPADGGRGREVREYGSIDGNVSALDSVIRKLHSRGKRHLEFVYEAGPCGYEIYRHLSAKGFKCTVMDNSSRVSPFRGFGFAYEGHDVVTSLIRTCKRYGKPKRIS